MPETTTIRISPAGDLDVLSKAEVAKLLDTSQSGLYQVFRQCSLAVLNCGSDIDNARDMLEGNRNFDIKVLEQERGIRIELTNPPESAFVDGVMIKGIREHLFAVLRDIIYVSNEISGNPNFDITTPHGITDSVFHILRNAGVLKAGTPPNIVVCWGGHAISREEYEYTKEVGYQMGLRGLDICTGCGPGAMKGPMKGAAIGHAKQRIRDGRYLGITEPGIIAAEPPNPIVNELVIMPDIEKRLEAFVRAGHGIVVFPGGVGTVEELLYFLGIRLHPENRNLPFPMILAGPASSRNYFQRIDEFFAATLGEEARQHYEIIIDDPAETASRIHQGIRQVRKFRKARDDAYFFNWLMKIDPDFQRPFHVSHESMRSLDLHEGQESHLLAANLRRAFSGIVSGNVKADGIRAVEEYGHFELQGDRHIMEQLDALLLSFIAERRMKLATDEYVPCYRLVA
ncbi:MAG: LOG family protein [Pseudomonadales bacterium]|nr:LOG family protein [Pseudomonadales bacterium]